VGRARGICIKLGNYASFVLPAIHSCRAENREQAL
jgi:hypothetical protein